MTNVALVVLDTLRKDAFDRHFGWLPGRRFERAYSTANWTVPAHASLFTGRYASEVGVHADHLYCDCPDPTLAETLADAGYTTRAFSANTNITGHFGFDRGFADFRTPDRFESSIAENTFNWRAFTRTTTATGKRKYLRGVYECLASDVETVPSLLAGLRLVANEAAGVKYGGALEALAEIEDIDFGDREFLFVNLMDAHEPYKAPSEYMSVDEPPLTEAVGDVPLESFDRGELPLAYDDCARYLSNVYEEIFEALSAEFDYIVTCSDHGEMLGEGGVWGHEHGVYPELLRVPLVVSGDGLSGEHARPVSLLDVHRTVLARAGVDADSRGCDLLDDADTDCEYLTEYHGLTPWSKRKLEDAGHGDEVERHDAELFGYAAPVDYYGYRTIGGFEGTGTPAVDDPEARLRELVAERDVRRVDRETDVPEEIKAQLEDLGYA